MLETKKLRELLATMVTDRKMQWFIDHTVIYLTDEIDKYLEAHGIINDQKDLGYYSAVQYVELKARWIQMNLRLNY